MLRLKIYLCFLLASLGLSLSAQKGDSIRFSLLTCEPGQEIYELFGHTAIRYQNFTRQIDEVYNYGMFSFATPNFVMRFVKGETDYQLGVLPFAYFRMEYAMRGSSVYEQSLNLDSLEKIQLLTLLENNYLPANRVYRYNYFYDNCTTRARDIIESAVNGQVVYPDGDADKSFRDIIHEFATDSPWDRLGIDLCLGSEADRPISTRLQMFSPLYMMHFAEGAVIINKEGKKRNFVQPAVKIVDVPRPEPISGFPLSPFVCSFLLMGLLCGWAFWEWRNRKVRPLFELSLYAVHALAGCIIVFLFFFSIHPTVGSNWLVWFFNPLYFLLAVVGCLSRDTRIKLNIWIIILSFLTLFMVVLALAPQKFDLSVLPLAFGFWAHALSHVLVYRK